MQSKRPIIISSIVVTGLVIAGLLAATGPTATGQVEPSFPEVPSTQPRSIQPRSPLPQPTGQQGLPPGCLQVVSQPGGPITAVIYDPQQQVLGVYHISQPEGKIELKSIRKIEWDLQMQHFNGTEPLPEEIRNGLRP